MTLRAATRIAQPSSADAPSTSRRRSLGIYYTPDSAADLLAEWAIQSPNDTVLEPSFGGCSILLAAVRRLTFLGCETPARNLSGCDVDRAAFAHLQSLVGDHEAAQFVHTDFLSVSPRGDRFTAVVANPPFVAYHRMTKEQRDSVLAWRHAYRPSFAMTASLWAYFLAHAMCFLKPGGRLAFVLPWAALRSDYAAPLLTEVRERFGQVTAIQVREQLFIQAGAEERALILLASGYRTHGSKQRGLYRELTIATTEELAGAIASSGKSSHASANKETDAQKLVARVLSDGALARLSAMAKVKIGEVVGDTPFFVKPLAEWEQIGLSSRWLAPLVTRTAQMAGLRLTVGETQGRYSKVPSALVVSNKRKSKALDAYLKTYPVEARASNITFAKRNEWYRLSYDRRAGAFIGSLSHDAPRIVLNTARVSCANGLYKLTAASDGELPSWLAAASMTSIFQLSAEHCGRVRGSGGLKLEPSDVGNLLIPSHPPKGADALLAQLDDLVRRREGEAATRVADKAFFVDSGLVSASELTSLHNELREMRDRRKTSR